MLLPTLTECQALLEPHPISIEQTEQGLCLLGEKNERMVIDFLSGHYRHRQQFGGGQGQLLAKACQVKAKPLLYDVTAGLGRDAFVLAGLGARVVMIERSPILALMLHDALKRFYQAEPDSPLSLQLVHANAIDTLHSLTADENPDIIYFDPMHPERKKSALVKKELRMVRYLVGDDEDKLMLFRAACQVAKKRVVVKWPAKAQAIIETRPSVCYNGKSTRFDVFVPMEQGSKL